MKKLMLITIILSLMITGLFGEKLKLGILNFNAKDSDSKYMIGRTGIYRDFKKIFKKNDDIELLDTDDTREFYEKSGYSNLNAIEPTEVYDFTKDLAADILVWGDIFFVSSSRYKVVMSVMKTEGAEKNTVTFEFPKNRKKRQPIIQKNVLAEIEDLTADNSEQLMNIAKQYFSNKQYDLANAEYEKILKSNPENIEVLLSLGYINFKLSNFAVAEDYYRGGLLIEPANKKLTEFLVKLLVYQERFQEAAEELEILAENDSENVELWFEIGETYKKGFDLDTEAMQAFEEVLNLDENNIAAKKEIGLIFYKDNSFEKAIEYLSEANKEWPDDEDVAKKLSISYLKAGKLEDAIEKYKELLKSNPDEIKNYLNIANAYRILATEKNSQGKKTEANTFNKKAIINLKKLLDIDSKNTTAILRISDAYIAINDLSKAEQFANQVIVINDKNIDSYKLLTKIYQTRGYAKYNEYVDFQKKSSKAIGKEANELIEKRDSAKNESNRLFELTKKYINKSISISDNSSEKKSLKKQLNDINKLLEESKTDSFFD
ncbi:MAG: tetratricopeptide repeat protein [Candidatus Cloacimonadota bacterium]|nr:tetratricopeptide repeat protein [Candidatus Cloacimonadota bacterium]